MFFFRRFYIGYNETYERNKNDKDKQVYVEFIT